MPKNTRVYRCVKKLTKKKFKYGAAIAICQKSTKQNYMTGKYFKKKKQKNKTKKHKRKNNAKK